MKWESLISDSVWEFDQPKPTCVKNLKRKFDCSSSFAQVLATRSNCDHKLIKSLTQPDLVGLHSPFELDGIKSAIDRIKSAKARDEKLFIHGDFDVDGITSSAILYLALKELGFSEIKVEIGNRALGHGLSDQVVHKIIAGNFDLLITCDCGINNGEEIRILKENGVETIITDHHSPPCDLPEAVAILNPKLQWCNYPNEQLAGVGVAYKLVAALSQDLGTESFHHKKYMDLVMLGTVADLVPLIHRKEVENKILVYQGLKHLAQGIGNKGLQILIKNLSLAPENLTAGRISYIVAPHLNAANRVGDPRVAFLLLVTNNNKRLNYLANVLIDYNRDRQIEQEELKYQADELIRSKANLDRDKIIILEGDNWNPGIIGLIASHMVEQYNLPAIVISKGTRESQASARSIPEFNIIECLKRYEHRFIQYGGHEAAGGFKIKNQDLPTLKKEIKTYADQKLDDFAFLPSRIDASVTGMEINLDLYQEICKLSPFGMGNPKPRFITDEIGINGVKTVGNQGKHLKFRAQLAENFLEVIGYDWVRYENTLQSLEKTRLIFKLGVNHWMGESRVQLELEDIV